MQPTNQMDHAAYQRNLRHKTDDQLLFIIKDAKEAMEANPENPKNGYYADEVNYATMELHRRKGRKAKGEGMVTKLASGWGTDKSPGQVFQTREAALVALAWVDVQALLSEKAKEALKAGGYAGERPLIQALLDSVKHWEGVGDAGRASQAKAKAEEMLGGTKTPEPAVPARQPAGLITRPSVKTKGWTQVLDNDRPLIELPTPEMANEFVAQYQQAKGDEELEVSVYDEFKAKAQSARPPEPAAPTAKFDYAPSGRGEEGDEPSKETFQLGDMRVEAESHVQFFPKKAKPGEKPVIDPKTGKPKTNMGRRYVRTIEVFHPSQELPIYRFWYDSSTNTFSVRSNLLGKTKEVQEKGQWDARIKPKVVPVWTPHEAQNPAQLVKTLASFTKDPNAEATMKQVMQFFGLSPRMASNNVSVRVAQHPPRGPGFIERRIMEAMDDAEEIGGPEGHEYVAMMERIAAEASKRARNAKASTRESLDPREGPRETQDEYFGRR